MTNRMPRMRAGFRGMKAEGGWGVVCTGYVSIHPSTDDSPLPYATLWDENDIRSHVLMTDAVHAHGALAGIELWHGGGSVSNKTSRLPPLSPSGVSWMATHVGFMGNQRSKAMDAADIKNLLRWQAEAARKARRAGFDIIYVYAGMGYLPYEFLLPEWNRRTDAYGGSVANRVRIVRELLEVTKNAVGDTCGVALRISLEELRARRERAGCIGGTRGGRAPGRCARSVGREDGFESDRLCALALHTRGKSRAGDRLRQENHQESPSSE